MVRLFTLMRHPIIQALQAKERVSKVELLTNLANVMSTFFTSQLTLDPRTTIRPSIAGFQCMALVCRCRMLAFTERSFKNVSFFQGRLCNDSFSNLSCDLAFLVDFCGASQILERKHKLSSWKITSKAQPTGTRRSCRDTAKDTLVLPSMKEICSSLFHAMQRNSPSACGLICKGLVNKVIQFFGGARVLNTTWTRSFPNCPFVFFPAISFSCSFHFLSYNFKLKDSLSPKTCFQIKPQIKWARGTPQEPKKVSSKG